MALRGTRGFGIPDRKNGIGELPMKIPSNLTQAWLDKKGYKLVEIYRNGYRLAILRSVGRKWAHLTVAATGDNFKVPVDQLMYRPVVRKRGQWTVDHN